ncbi:MAG: hypothetical protein ACM3PC_13060 [Deltaproteobacteria bacterium]
MPHDYDVAISFLYRDEPLALQLREAVSPLKVFVFSKAQEEIAGRQGDEAFGEVFRERSLVSLVLFRQGWGQTRWTRVEESAIRDHLFNTSPEHLMFVNLDGSENPKWVPGRYIYFDARTFGLKDLVGAVKWKCAHLGVELKEPSAAERAAGIAAKERLDLETEQLLRSSAQPVYDEAKRFFADLDGHVTEIEKRTGWQIIRGTGNYPHSPAYVVCTDPISLAILTEWRPSDAKGVLRVTLVHGRIPTPDEARAGQTPSMPPRELRRDEISLDRLARRAAYRQAGAEGVPQDLQPTILLEPGSPLRAPEPSPQRMATRA